MIKNNLKSKRTEERWTERHKSHQQERVARLGRTTWGGQGPK